MQSLKRYFRVKREDIGYLAFILESYNGLAVVTTIDPRQAVIEILVAPQSEGLFEDLINYLRDKEGLKLVPDTLDNEYKG